MNKHQGKLELISTILKNSNPSSPLKIINICKMDFSEFDLYIDWLTEAGFLKVIRGHEEEVLLETTRKGKQFLKDYYKIRKIIES